MERDDSEAAPCNVPITRWDGGCPRADTDELAAEEPLEIRVRGRAISVTMRTPGHDDELAAGFLLSEGVIGDRSDLLNIEPCERNSLGNMVNAQVAPLVPLDMDRLTRHVFASSSCGLCGKATIEALQSRLPPLEPGAGPTVRADVLQQMPDQMRQTQATFDRTGGLHAAALFTAEGQMLVLREDVGRHNAVDKVLGHALLHGMLPLHRHVLLVSGRTSFEIVQKALAGRLAIVAAVSAPSSLAVRFADENRQTLIGFLRGQRMNVYTHPQRVM